MEKIYVVRVYEPSNVAIVENQSVGGYICRVHFQDHDSDEKAIHFAELIADNLNEYFNNL